VVADDEPLEAFTQRLVDPLQIHGASHTQSAG
jgi:hypothetical protein